ncbi:MAG: transcriptional regulator, partial [Thaumarchaeota archaeon]|nr:transcriptional regulator [Nitrososphaerota archaeon]MDE0525118.1 transcriptional regulator [Nitrososphaerota archaeon]
AKADAGKKKKLPASSKSPDDHAAADTAKKKKGKGSARQAKSGPASKKPASDKAEEKVPELTLEEKIESELTEEEIERFQIEKVNMEQLIRKVCDILAEHESAGMLQNNLWKKLKLSDMTGSRLALKLERMGTITREKLLENGRWTYKLILKKTPISTQSIEDAPCLVCKVEQKCTLDGDISPRTCQYLEDWVVSMIKKPRFK